VEGIYVAKARRQRARQQPGSRRKPQHP